MSEQIFNTRIQQKHDIEANWVKAVNFIPKAGEIIIYDADENHNYTRLKIGDGLTLINNLNFSTGSLAIKDTVSKTDLDIDVQVSLGKADTAIQVLPPYPVTSVNGQTGAIVLNTIPSYSTSNNDQFLKIVDGSPAWVTIQNAEEVNF